MKKTPLIILVISLLLLSLLVIFLFLKPKDQVVNEEPEVISVTEDDDPEITETPLIEDHGTEINEEPLTENDETEIVGTAVYRNEKYNLTFEYFEDWQIIEREDLNEIRLSKEYEIPDSVHDYYLRPPDTMRLNINIKDNPYDLRAYEFFCIDNWELMETYGEILSDIDIDELKEELLLGKKWEVNELGCPPSFNVYFEEHKKINDKEVFVYSYGNGGAGARKYVFNHGERIIEIMYQYIGVAGYLPEQRSEIERHLEEIVKSIEFLSN